MKPVRVLIVDDDVNFTQLVKTILERTGKYEVWEDNDGLTTLDIARSFNPDLILLDIQMPATSGAFVARCLRSDPMLQHIPVVYVTAIVPKTDATAGRELGGFPFLAKPVGLRELMDCIKANRLVEKQVA
jgi:CheY-like chemotaxis protein